MLKNFYEISENLKNGLNDASEEIKEMAEHVRESAIFTFIFGKRKKKGKQK